MTEKGPSSMAPTSLRVALLATAEAYESMPYPLKCEPKAVAKDLRALLRILDAGTCNDTLRWAGYVNVCDLPAAHQGRHQMTQPGNDPVIWGPAQRGGIPTRNGAPE